VRILCGKRRVVSEDGSQAKTSPFRSKKGGGLVAKEGGKVMVCWGGNTGGERKDGLASWKRGSSWLSRRGATSRKEKL